MFCLLVKRNIDIAREMMKISQEMFTQVLLLIVVILMSCCEQDNPIDENPEPFPVVIIEQSEIDVNGDNNPDFSFEIEFIGTEDNPMSVMCMTINLNPFDNFLLYKDDDGNVPFSFGEIIQENIDSSFSWFSYNAGIIYKYWHINQGWDNEWSGQWTGIANKYLPIALSINDSMFYGWIEMSVDTDKDTSFVQVRGYNYNEIAGEPILAGQ